MGDISASRSFSQAAIEGSRDKDRCRSGYCIFFILGILPFMNLSHASMLATSTTAPNSRFKILTKPYLQNLDQNKLKNIKLGAIIIQRQGRIYCVFGADRQDNPMIRPGCDKEKSKIGVLSGHGRTWSPFRGIPIKEGGASMQI